MTDRPSSTDAEGQEFFEDFGASLRRADLVRLLDRARLTGDRELRLLVKQHQTLRGVAADALRALEPHLGEPLRDGDASKPRSYPIGFLKFLLEEELQAES